MLFHTLKGGGFDSRPGTYWMSSVLIVEFYICWLGTYVLQTFNLPSTIFCPKGRLIKNSCFKTHNLLYHKCKKNYIPTIWLNLVNSPWKEQQDISKFKMFFAQKVALNVASTNLCGSALLIVFVKPVFQPKHFPILLAPRSTRLCKHRALLWTVYSAPQPLLAFWSLLLLQSQRSTVGWT